jgi:hypothetical protein
MKKLLLIIAAAALGGCAVAPPGPAYYGSRPVGQTDPAGWQVVSVTPVAPGTGARASASGEAGTVTTSDAPVYASTPVYAPRPYLYDPYWYPPVSIGLGFSFGNSWGHRGGWGHGGGRGGFRHR